MITVSYRDYSTDLANFIKKHSKKCDYQVYTSPFENGQYHKDYWFEDGAMFTEINEMDYEEAVEVTVHGISTVVYVKMIRHEYWSTDDATSKYWYEKR